MSPGRLYQAPQNPSGVNTRCLAHGHTYLSLDKGFSTNTPVLVLKEAQKVKRGKQLHEDPLSVAVPVPRRPLGQVPSPGYPGPPVQKPRKSHKAPRRVKSHRGPDEHILSTSILIPLLCL